MKRQPRTGATKQAIASSKERLELDRIIQGDCIKVLSSLPEKSIDLIFADPPYNLQLQQELFRPDMTKVDAVDDAWDQFTSLREYDRFTKAWLKACRRVLKDTGTIWVIGSYHNIYRVGSLLMDQKYWILNDVIWIKDNPMPNFRGVRFTNAHETLIWAQKQEGATYNFNYKTMKALNDDVQMRSDWTIPICSGKERIRINGEKAHSTQKPEALLYRVILSSSDPGDVILDPFFGTGTMGAVAKKLGRHWIGIETDPEYVRIAQDRIDAIESPLSSDEALTLDEKRKRPRIPFGMLIEHGLLQPGQSIYFTEQQHIEAMILADGHLQYKGTRGSIHKIGSMIQGKRCNGWEHWYYVDKETGKFVVIDSLRERIFQGDFRDNLRTNDGKNGSS